MNPSILGRTMGGFQKKYTSLDSGELPTNPNQGPSNLVRQPAYDQGTMILPDIDGFNRGTTRPSMLAPPPVSPMSPPIPNPIPNPMQGPPIGMPPSVPPQGLGPSNPMQMMGARPPVRPPMNPMMSPGMPPRRY